MWQVEVVDGGIRQYTSLVLDSNGRPHISYYDYDNGDLLYAQWDGVMWQIETVDSGGDVGLFTSLALDSSDRAHISYFDNDNTDLKVAQWNGAMWQIETVDSNGDIGRFSSLALDGNEYPSVGYYDSTNTNLKLAQWDGAMWQIETVDSYGLAAGRFTSLALDSQERPHITYQDGNTLGYAHTGSTTFIEPTGGQLTIPQVTTISVPASVFSDTTKFYFTALQGQPSQPDVQVFFELSAVNASNGLPVELASGQTINATLNYEQNNIPPGVCENLLTLSGWIGKLSVWESKPSIIDIDNNTVTAELDRLGINAILGSYCINLPFIRH
jgi:hypothetical protein